MNFSLQFPKKKETYPRVSQPLNNVLVFNILPKERYFGIIVRARRSVKAHRTASWNDQRRVSFPNSYRKFVVDRCAQDANRDNPENCRNRYRWCCKRAAPSMIDFGSAHYRTDAHGCAPITVLSTFAPSSPPLTSVSFSRSDTNDRLRVLIGCLFFLAAREKRQRPWQTRREIKTKTRNTTERAGHFLIYRHECFGYYQRQNATIMRAIPWSDYAHRKNSFSIDNPRRTTNDERLSAFGDVKPNIIPPCVKSRGELRGNRPIRYTLVERCELDWQRRAIGFDYTVRRIETFFLPSNN